MSTFGGSADRMADLARKHERKVDQHAIKLQDAVRFAKEVLADREGVRSIVARDLALDALRLKEVDVMVDFDAVSPVAWVRVHAALIAIGDAIAAGLPAKAMRPLFWELVEALEAYTERYRRSPPLPWRLCAREAGQP
jgi:hypothetical protein